MTKESEPMTKTACQVTMVLSWSSGIMARSLFCSSILHNIQDVLLKDVLWLPMVLHPSASVGHFGYSLLCICMASALDMALFENTVLLWFYLNETMITAIVLFHHPSRTKGSCRILITLVRKNSK